MNISIWKSCLLGGLLCVGDAPLTYAQDIRCWTNADGMTQCGNVVPPEYSQKEHAEYNERAVKVQEFDRAKTEAELEQERLAAAREKEEEARRKAKQAEDQKLLDLFGSEEDIQTTLEARLSNIDLSIERIRTFIANTEKNLADLKNSLEVESSRHLTDEQKNKIRQDIKEVSERISQQNKTLAAKLREKASVRDEFQSYLMRYREIQAERAAEAEQEARKKAELLEQQAN